MDEEMNDKIVDVKIINDEYTCSFIGLSKAQAVGLAPRLTKYT